MTNGGKGSGRKPAVSKQGLVSSKKMASAFKHLLEQGDDLNASATLNRAQEKAFDAMEAASSKRRLALAREALAISPLCSDGYLVLAREAATLEEALPLLRQAVEAGAQTLGSKAFANDVGHFWGLIETRPYMRARHELGLALWEKGASEEAVVHFDELLRLNPDDNQGIRYVLANILLELGDDEAAARLLNKYEHDGSAYWAWSRALLSYRQNGDAAVSRKALAEAVANNPHVAPFLLGQKAIPEHLANYYSPGEESEALSYLEGGYAAWMLAKGAKSWLEACLGTASSSSGLPAENDEPAEAGRIDDATLALLLLGLHDGERAWKGFDWNSLDRLYRKGFISNPVGKAKSVEFTPAGLEAAKDLYRALFGEGGQIGSRR